MDLVLCLKEDFSSVDVTPYLKSEASELRHLQHYCPVKFSLKSIPKAKAASCSVTFEFFSASLFAGMMHPARTEAPERCLRSVGHRFQTDLTSIVFRSVSWRQLWAETVKLINQMAHFETVGQFWMKHLIWFQLSLFSARGLSESLCHVQDTEGCRCWSVSFHFLNSHLRSNRYFWASCLSQLTFSVGVFPAAETDAESL